MNDEINSLSNFGVNIAFGFIDIAQVSLKDVVMNDLTIDASVIITTHTQS